MKKKFFPAVPTWNFNAAPPDSAHIHRVLFSLFSSVVALRCHSFLACHAVEKPAHVPIHCCNRASTLYARENSLELKLRKKRASRCFYFPLGLFRPVLLILRHRRVLVAAALWHRFFFLSLSCRTMKGMLFSGTAFRKWYTSMDVWFTRFNLYGTYNILLFNYFLLFTKWNCDVWYKNVGLIEI